MPKGSSGADGLAARDYAALADFRYGIRKFLAFSEAAASRVGLPPQQHQALMAIAAHTGPEPPSVGYVAERLLLAPHTAAELVSRCAAAGLIEKSPSERDRRRAELRLTPRAFEILAELTEAHLEELRAIKPSLQRLLSELETRERG